MAHEVLMPKLSSTMAEGSITQWFKEEGDSVEVGEAIFEVMTDKIAIEVEAYEEGILLKRYYKEDESAPINSVVAYLGVAGEEVPEIPPSTEESVVAKTIQPDHLEKVEAETAITKSVHGQKQPATPAARKLARELGLDLAEIIGSGRNGRIHKADVASFSQPVRRELNRETLIPWQGMRKAVADSMVASKATIPHVTMNAQVDLSQLVHLREQLLPVVEAKTAKRLSYMEVIVKAVSVALKEFPRLNAHALADGIHEFSQVNIGLAVALTDGLVVPVIKDVAQMGLSELAVAVKSVTQKAREGKLIGEDMSGGTFTISSLGAGVVRQFNPIINAPEVAILGVSSMFDGSYKGAEGQIELRPSVTLSLSFDHRVSDGAPVADFLATLVALLECPYKLLV